MIEYFELSCYGFFGPHNSLVIDFIKEEYTYSVFNEGRRWTEKVTLTPSKLKKLQKALGTYGFSSWGAKYLDSTVLDGTKWHLKVSFDGNDYQSEGSNAFPSNWKKMIAAIDRYLDIDMT